MKFDARLGSQVKILTVFAAVIMLGSIGVLAELYQSAEPKAPSPLFAAMIGDCILVAALFFCGLFCKIKSYEIQSGKVTIVRMLDRKEISFGASSIAENNPLAFKGAMRTIGLGGFFSVTGFYYSRSLGNFKAYVTNPEKSVLIKTGDKIVVISPESPTEFIDYFNRSKSPVG